MTPAERLRLAVALGFGRKSLTGTPPIFGTGGGTEWWRPAAGRMPLTGVGTGVGNSAVVACLQVIATTFPEAPLRYAVENEDGDPEWNLAHPAAALIRRPNPYMTGGLLWASKVYAEHLEGDWYLLIIRNGSSEPVALYPLHPGHVTPVGSADGTVLIEKYVYAPPGIPPRDLKPVEDIVHTRSLGLDPDDHRHGFAPVKTVLREVLGDEAAGQFTTALLSNLGIPGVVISPKEVGDTIGEVSANRMTQTFREKFGGRHRGEPYVSSGAVDVKVLSFSPEQMDLAKLRRVPEERISAVTGVPAILAGLGAGLERATYSNAGNLRESYTESKLVPYWRESAEQLTFAFLEPNYNPPSGGVLLFDTRKVRALQDDQDKLTTRWTSAVNGTVATIAEGRAALGLPVGPEHEFFLLPTGKVPVAAKSLGDENAPPPVLEEPPVDDEEPLEDETPPPPPPPVEGEE